LVSEFERHNDQRHCISENKSDMRGIRPGWYAIEHDDNLSSGRFSSREECVKKAIQPTNEAMTSKSITHLVSAVTVDKRTARCRHRDEEEPSR
jgi:hypothetical protein